VLTVTGPPIHDGAVVVDDGRIVDVGPADTVAVRHPDAPELDLGAAVLAPGFVDTHCHLEWANARPAPEATTFADWLRMMMAAGAHMTPHDFAASAERGARAALANGTTTVVDSGPTGAGAEALRSLGLRGVVHVEAFGRDRGADADRAADTLAERIAALDGGALVRLGVAPHAPYTVGPELWAALARHPDLADRPWTTHLAESPEELPAISGCDGPLRSLFASRGSTPGAWPGAGSVVSRLHAAGALRPGLVCAHCVHLEESDPSLMAGAGVGVAHCPTSNRSLNVGTMRIDPLTRAGLPVGLGTDSPATDGRYDLRHDARMAVDLGRDPASVLRLMTLGGARVAGLDHLVGSVEVGRRADLVAIAVPDPLDTSPETALIASTAPPVMVMVDGTILGPKPAAA